MRELIIMPGYEEDIPTDEFKNGSLNVPNGGDSSFYKSIYQSIDPNSADLKDKNGQTSGQENPDIAYSAEEMQNLQNYGQ